MRLQRTAGRRRPRPRRAPRRDHCVAVSEYTKASAKGVDDLIEGYAASRAAEHVRLVVAGRGPQEVELRARAEASPLAERITFLTDVDDSEKPPSWPGDQRLAAEAAPRTFALQFDRMAVFDRLFDAMPPRAVHVA